MYLFYFLPSHSKLYLYRSCQYVVGSWEWVGVGGSGGVGGRGDVRCECGSSFLFMHTRTHPAQLSLYCTQADEERKLREEREHQYRMAV